MSLWSVLFMYLSGKKYLVVWRHHTDSKGNLAKEDYLSFYRGLLLMRDKGLKNNIPCLILPSPSFKNFSRISCLRTISSSSSAVMRGYQQNKSTSHSFPILLPPNTQMHRIIVDSVISDRRSLFELLTWSLFFFFFLARGYCALF